MYKFLSERLNESLSTAKKEYYLTKIITDEKIIEYIASYDPSGAKYTYTHTMVRWYVADRDINLEEVRDTINKLIDYEKKGWINSKNINSGMISQVNKKFKTFLDFKTIFEDNSGIRFHPSIANNKDIVFVTENDDYYVIMPFLRKDFIDFGKNSTWCVSMNNKIVYYIDYVIDERKTFYFIIKKDNKSSRNDNYRKMAVTVTEGEYIECYDINDKSITLKQVVNNSGIPSSFYSTYNYNPLQLEPEYSTVDAFTENIFNRIESYNDFHINAYNKDKSKLIEIDKILEYFNISCDLNFGSMDTVTVDKVLSEIYLDEEEENIPYEVIINNNYTYGDSILENGTFYGDIIGNRYVSIIYYNTKSLILNNINVDEDSVRTDYLIYLTNNTVDYVDNLYINVKEFTVIYKSDFDFFCFDRDYNGKKLILCDTNIKEATFNTPFEVIYISGEVDIQKINLSYRTNFIFDGRSIDKSLSFYKRLKENKNANILVYGDVPENIEIESV